MGYPPLPRSIHGLAGPIRVDRPMVVNRKDLCVVGQWEHARRRIAVKATLSREAAWPILAHEMAHAAMDDAGIRLRLYTEERICEAFAAATMATVLAFASAADF